MGTGDLLIANKQLFHDGESVLVTSWRCIPEKGVLTSFLKTPVQLATILAIDSENEHLDHCVAVNPDNRTLQETDGCEVSPSTCFWGFAGTVCLNPCLFSLLPEQYPFTRPTSLLSMLHRVNQARPNQITVHSLVCRPFLRCVHLLVPNPSPSSSLHLFLDALLSGPVTSFVEDAFTVFSFTVPEHSILRYLYGSSTPAGPLACERRTIPRQLLVSSDSSPLRVRDSLEAPLVKNPKVTAGVRVEVSLERWRWNRGRRFVAARAGEGRVEVRPGWVACELARLEDVEIEVATDGELMVDGDESITSSLMAKDSSMINNLSTISDPSTDNNSSVTNNNPSMTTHPSTHSSHSTHTKATHSETITLTAAELSHCLNTLSLDHADGRVVKSLHDGPLELHLLLSRALSPSLDHQLLRGAALSYRPRVSPLQIGHRGCGMNIVATPRGMTPRSPPRPRSKTPCEVSRRPLAAASPPWSSISS